MHFIQSASGNRNRNSPLRLSRSGSQGVFLDIKFVFADHTDCRCSFIIRTINLRTVHQRKVSQRSVCINQCCTRYLIGSISIRFRCMITPPPFSGAAFPDIKFTPGNNSRLCTAVLKSDNNRESFSVKLHKRTAVLHNPVTNVRIAHGEFMIFIDSDFPLLGIEIFSNLRRFSYRPFCNTLKVCLTGEIRTGFFSIRNLITGDSSGIIRLLDGSV